jgi:uncharacterized cupredoxin-like copper-binding protein
MSISKICNDGPSYRVGEAPRAIPFGLARLPNIDLSVMYQKAIEQFTRDTVLVGPRESVTIGFVPQHPGIWLTHCHIQEHAESGMMTTIEVKN